ncbi:MAG: hypothetical protein Q9192_003874 [Flavoplaca navasiana]
MTPQFYSRYIPPSNNAKPEQYVDNVAESPPAKKRKKKKKHEQDADAGTLETPLQEYSTVAANPQASDQKKHVKVLSKYEKSIKSAANVAEEVSSNIQPNGGVSTPPEVHGLLPLPQPAQVSDSAPPSALSALPSWMTNPIEASTVDVLPFEKLSLNPDTTTSLKAKGFREAFAIQAAVLELLLPGVKQHKGDLCIAASTGSGKTLAYALPMIEALRGHAATNLRGLVVVPTRELVNQAYETLVMCSKGCKLKIGTAFGSKTLKGEQEALMRQDLKYDPDAYRLEQLREMDVDEALLNWDDDQYEGPSPLEENPVDIVNDYSSTVDVLICTPGRLVEHLEHTRGFTLDHVQWLVIDEADRLLEDGFQQWVGTIMPALERQDPPKAWQIPIMQEFRLLRKREVRKVILSATMSRDVSKLKELNLRWPKLVMLQGDRGSKQEGGESDDATTGLRASDEVGLPSTLQEIAIQIKDEEKKPLYLIELLRDFSSSSSWGSKGKARSAAQERSKIDNDGHSMDIDEISDHASISDATSSSGSPSSNLDSDSDSDISMEDPQTTPKLHGYLIFTHSTSSAHRLSRLLSLLAPQQALTAATLTKSSTKSSEKVLSRFRDGKLDTIITTDRASRGLDIGNLAYVINYDMPSSINNYVHRVGRTARAGKAGTAITLVGWKEGRWFWNEIARGQRIQRSNNKKITRRYIKEEGWNAEEMKQYSDALGKLGEETRAEGK